MFRLSSDRHGIISAAIIIKQFFIAAATTAAAVVEVASASIVENAPLKNERISSFQFGIQNADATVRGDVL